MSDTTVPALPSFPRSAEATAWPWWVILDPRGVRLPHPDDIRKPTCSRCGAEPTDECTVVQADVDATEDDEEWLADELGTRRYDHDARGDYRGQLKADDVIHAITGPFLSRHAAEQHLQEARHRFSDRAEVWCLSASSSPQWQRLHTGLVELRKSAQQVLKLAAEREALDSGDAEELIMTVANRLRGYFGQGDAAPEEPSRKVVAPAWPPPNDCIAVLKDGSRWVSDGACLLNIDRCPPPIPSAYRWQWRRTDEHTAASFELALASPTSVEVGRQSGEPVDGSRVAVAFRPHFAPVLKAGTATLWKHLAIVKQNDVIVALICASVMKNDDADLAAHVGIDGEPLSS